jgi:23S rRNA (guanine745-N1)-methyltransferase
MWVCPHCREKLCIDSEGSTWACINNHRFDIAREGYVNLLPSNRKSSAQPGDSPAMLAARRRIHDAGFYQPLADAITDALSQGLEADNVLDLGCGEGFYCSALQRALPWAQIYGVDIAKPAVRMAAKKHIRCRFAVASAHGLPLSDSSVDVALRVFAPSDDIELHRVLSSGGLYLEVSPAPRHLWELRENLYRTPRPHAAAREEIAGMQLRWSDELSYTTEVVQPALFDLIAMTPFAHRGNRDLRQRLETLEQLCITMMFSLRLFEESDLQDNATDV